MNPKYNWCVLSGFVTFDNYRLSGQAGPDKWFAGFSNSASRKKDFKDKRGLLIVTHKMFLGKASDATVSVPLTR